MQVWTGRMKDFFIDVAFVLLKQQRKQLALFYGSDFVWGMGLVIKETDCQFQEAITTKNGLDMKQDSRRVKMPGYKSSSLLEKARGNNVSLNEQSK